MGKDRPPSFQWYPSDFAASMHKYGFSDSDELAYRRALDASFEEQAFGVGSPDDWLRWSRANGDGQAFLSKIRLVTMECPDGSLAQIRMAHQRMEQEAFYRSKQEAGRRGGLAKASRAMHVLQQNVPSSSSSSSSLEPKDKTSGVSAACLARIRRRFPNLDLDLIEGKMLSYHQMHPYKSLDMAMWNWCKAADERGTEQLTTDGDWVPC